MTGKRGPVSKTKDLKKLSGSTTPLTDAEDGVVFKPLDGMPIAPPWIQDDPAALDFWNRNVPHLIRYGLLGEMHLDSFAHLSMIHSALLAHYKLKTMPSASLLGAYQTLSSAFAMNTAACARMKMAVKDKKKPNTFS